MLRKTLKRLLPLVIVGLGLTFAPFHVAPRVHAQDEGDEPQLDDQTRAELQKLAKRLQTADEAIQNKDYENAIKHYEKFFKKLDESKLEPKYKLLLQPDNAWYNYACALSLTNKKDEAIKAFGKSVQLGFHDWKHIEEDTDLDNIRKDDAFKKIVEDGKADDKKQATDAVKKALSQPALFDFDFDVKTIDGKALKLSDLKGKVVIVDFWGTWCPPCVAEIPHFVKLYENYKDKGLEIVGLALEHERDAEKATAGVQAFAKEHGVKYPLVRLERNEPALKMVPNFHAVPTTLFIDKDGKVRFMEVGGKPYEALESIVLPLLDAKPGEGNLSAPAKKADAEGDEKKEEPKAEPKKDEPKAEPKKDDKKGDENKPF